MAETYAGFIDVGYLRAEGARVIGLRSGSVRPNATAVAGWFRQLASGVLGHLAEHSSRLERPIRKALANTAVALDLLPEQLLKEFDAHWRFRPERQQKGCRHTHGAGHGSARRSRCLFYGGADLW